MENNEEFAQILFEPPQGVPLGHFWKIATTVKPQWHKLDKQMFERHFIQSLK